jgi:hypothetical protein
MPPKQRPHGSGSKSKARQRTDQTSVDRRWAAYLGGAIAVVVLASLLGWLLVGGGTEDAEAKARTALEAAGCRLKVVPAVENVSDHSDVDSPDEIVKKWNTDPPTTGPHFVETLLYGAYEEPVQLARVVHNMEHGAVVMHYGKDVPAATVAQLRAFYDDNERGTILAPYDKLGEQVTLSAWVEPGLQSAKSERGSGVQATCTAFDQKAFGTFFDAFQFKGPERFPAESMLPGGN